jgi:hypothetical protein
VYFIKAKERVKNTLYIIKIAFINKKILSKVLLISSYFDKLKAIL